MLRIFIGWDSRFPEPADVLRYSLLKHATIPLDIQYLKLDELKLRRPHDPLASTEFTYSRFLVPHLCGFRGTALFLDNDMLCLGDVREIANLDMRSLTLRVVQHDYQPTNAIKMYGCPQTSYPRKNWSSMMLMNCAEAQAVGQGYGRDANGRLSAPFSGHSRCRDRRVAQDVEYARLDGCLDETDSLHQRRAVVRAIPQSSARRDLVPISGRNGRRCKTRLRSLLLTLPRRASPAILRSAGFSVGRAWSRPAFFAHYAVCASCAAFGPRH